MPMGFEPKETTYKFTGSDLEEFWRQMYKAAYALGVEEDMLRAATHYKIHVFMNNRR